jgi:hypothetical protein
MIRHVISPKFLDRGVDRLEQSTMGVKLCFDKDPQEKVDRRRRLLKQLYDVARQELMFVTDQTGKSSLGSFGHCVALLTNFDNRWTEPNHFNRPVAGSFGFEKAKAEQTDSF